MKSKSYVIGVLVLILASIACNIGAPRRTLQLTEQAILTLATGFVQSTTPAPLVIPTSLITETPTPLGVLPPFATPALIATNTSSPGIPDWPLFRQGDQGPEVRGLQHLLRFKGQDLDVDGIFGAQTRAAVVAFQGQNGLAVDGIVGPQTWSALIQGATVQEGSTSQAVRAAQVLLRNKFGYSIDVDGIFGQQTENATRDFQTVYGLTVDGIIGPQTWRALVSVQT